MEPKNNEMYDQGGKDTKTYTIESQPSVTEPTNRTPFSKCKAQLVEKIATIPINREIA
jgi:hypothetical protein